MVIPQNVVQKYYAFLKIPQQLMENRTKLLKWLSGLQTPNVDGDRQVPREQNMSVIIIPDLISTNSVFHNAQARYLSPRAQSPRRLPEREA